MLRTLLTWTDELTGVFDPFGMRWTDDLFMSVIVGIYCCGLKGWPQDIPFQNLSNIRSKSLAQLVEAWKNGTLRIVKLTEDERAQAIADPKSVLPNTTLRPTPPPSPETRERVVPLVFHPADFHDLSQPSAAGTSTSALRAMTTTARPAKRKRKQRSDIKLARSRKLYYGRGVKSAEYVYEELSGGESEPDAKRFCEALSDDVVEEFPVEAADEVEGEVEGDVEDEIEEFSESEGEEDAIESATESWMLGEGSDAVEAESDVE